jgi:hypothetical protein
MGWAASAFANQSSPTSWNFCWITLSPGVSIQPGRIPLHLMRLAANALATFLVMQGIKEKVSGPRLPFT